MTVRGLLLGLLAGVLVLRLTGADRRWPWRVLDLVAPPGVDGPSREPDRTRSRASERSDPGLRPEDLERDLPLVTDLLYLAVTAGHSWHSAVLAVADTHPGPAARALARAVDAYRRGERLVHALDRLPDRHGDTLRPLTTCLASAATSGAPLAPALQRLADSERRRLRRRTEERVRRLPVLLLVPLVGLVLPAFLALTVVPVALTTARVGLEPLADLPATDSPAGAPSPTTTSP